ncbi:MAG: TetR/AcrR family transcriptional regulator [Christensenellales bacterium]
MKKEYRNAIRTKKMIRTAFTELLGEKKAMESITVGELCRRADIAKSTFYNHYDDVYCVAEEFENELIGQLSDIMDDIETSNASEYEDYIRKITDFLKANEDVYRKAMLSSDAQFFVEKLKSIISKKVFEENTVLPFSSNKAERYVQIRFLTNACVDTVVDYFRGTFTVSLDEICNIIINFINGVKA